jgi:hypothetical protein
MQPVPGLLGVDADGEAVLFASADGISSSLHLAPLPDGHVIRSIPFDGGSAFLTADRLHVITSTQLIDLRTGAAHPLASGVGAPLAISPAGDWGIAIDYGPAANLGGLVAVNLADGTSRSLGVSSGVPRAAAIADDATRFFVVSVDGGVFDARITIEVRAVADGRLQRSIPIDQGAVIPEVYSARLPPTISTVGDLVLVRAGNVGHRVIRTSDGALLWSTSDGQAQLSPVEGIVATRSEDGDLWIETDVSSQRRVRELPVSDPRFDGGNDAWSPPAFAYTPDGAQAVIPHDRVITLTDGRGGQTALPFTRSTDWTGRGLFVGADEFVSIETVGPGINEGVRKRRLPGGEVTAELKTHEAQSEWDGDIVPSPNGRFLAVALPESVRILRASDLVEATFIQRDAGRIAWAPDGNSLLTTPDAHYRDTGRAPFGALHAIERWALDAAPLATYEVPFIPTFATFTADGRTIVATGREGTVNTDPDQFASITWSDPLQAAVIDVATGVVTPTATAPVAVDASLRFATDWLRVERLADRAPVASFDLPAQQSDADSVVAGIDVRSRSIHPPVFSPDASLVTGWADDVRGVILYSSATGARVQGLNFSTFGAGALAFAPDGRRLAASEWSRGPLQLWCAGR